MVGRQAVDDRRLDEVAVREVAVGEPAAAGQDLAAVRLGLRDRALVGLDRLLVDHRAQVDVPVRAGCRS